MGKPLQHFVGAEIGNDNNRDFPGQFDHAFEKPGRRFSAVKGKIGNTCVSGTGRHCHSFNLSAAAGTAAAAAAAGTTAAASGNRSRNPGFVTGTAAETG
jgi:hypothetical protein